MPEQSFVVTGFSSRNLKTSLKLIHFYKVNSLCPVDCYGEGDEEDDIVEQSVTSLEWKGNCNIPLHCQDHHPHHRHGDGDVLDGVGQVGDHSVVPVILLMVMVIDDDIVKQEEKDEEIVNQSKNGQVVEEVTR